MSRKEKLKIEIDILKAIVLACLTAIFGVFGYSLINYEMIDSIRAIGIGVGVVLLIGALLFLGRRIVKNLKEIEELE